MLFLPLLGQTLIDPIFDLLIVSLFSSKSLPFVSGQRNLIFEPSPNKPEKQHQRCGISLVALMIQQTQTKMVNLKAS